MSTFDLIATSFCAIVLPFIIFWNIRDRTVPTSPLSRYLWREEPTLMWVGMAFLSVLVVFSVLDLLAYFEVVSQSVVQAVSPVIGWPMAILAVAVLVLTGKAIYTFSRQRSAS